MDERSRDKHADASTRAWDEAAAIHKPYRYRQLLAGFRKPGFVSMPATRLAVLREHGVAGRNAFQPCCNNGRDILSLKNLGAARCFGFDISAEFIQQGHDFAAAGNIDCELIQADVFNLDDSRNGQFDIGLITLGTFMWMPDLQAFFAAMKKLFREGGWLFIHEFHPLTDVIAVKRRGDRKQLALKRSYFDTKPRLWTGGLDYFGGKKYEATPIHRFHHKLSDICQALIANGFTIRTFAELEEDMRSGVFRASGRSPLPRSYTLTATCP